MDESHFHQEINEKLDRLANLYKEDQDIDDVLKSKFLNLKTKDSSLPRKGLLVTEDANKSATFFENLHTPPNNQSENAFQHRPFSTFPSLSLKDPLTSNSHVPSTLPLFPSAYTTPYAFADHTTKASSYASNPSVHLSPPNSTSSLPNLTSHLNNQLSPSNFNSPLSHFTKLSNPLDIYASTHGVSHTDEGPLSSRSDLLNLEQTLSLRKPTTNNNNISVQLSEQISFLLYELKKLKDVNSKLSDQLAACRHELSVTKNNLVMAESQMHSKSKQENLSNMLDDVYRSQKVRDMAVVERLKVANKERDSAVLKANLLQQRILGVQNKNDIVSELMRSHSVDSLKKTTDEFVRMMHDEKKRKRRMVEEEMETLLAEKELVLKQKSQIEQENKALLQKLQEEFKKRKAMQEKQKVTVRERDECMEKLRDLFEELQKLKVTYNLHGSLTKEKQLHQKYNVLLDGAQDEVFQRQKQVRELTHDKEELMARVRTTHEDIQSLKRQTNHLQQQLKDESKEKEQLNRLVAVLRRKLAEG